MKRAKFQNVFLGCLTFLFLFSSLVTEAAVLQYDTTYPVNTRHGMLAMFKAGTEVVFRPDGSVSAGYIANSGPYVVNTKHGLWVTFKAGTYTVFGPEGNVTSGTLQPSDFPDDFINLKINTKLGWDAPFKRGTAISFRDEGCVLSGTIGRNMTFFTNPQHSQSREFSAGTVVTFRPDGSAE